VNERAPKRQSRWTDEHRVHEHALLAEMGGLGEEEPRRAVVRDELVRMHMPLVEHLARRYRDRGEAYEDLVQVGMVGLVKAVDRFDTERGVEFSTFATPTIVGEIKRHFRDRTWSVKVPRRLQELHASVTKAVERLSAELGRSPTVHEIATRLDVTDQDVLDALEVAQAYTTSSIDAPARDEESSSIADSIGGEDPALEAVEYREALRPLLDALPERERRIVMLRFFHNQSQSQIAAAMGISQMHVSRLLAASLAKIRVGLESADAQS
jgi:RNA polymerase sigma-B factor